MNIKVGILTAAILLCGVGATRVYAQVNAEQVMNIGRNVLSMDDFMLAIQYFNQAIKAKPYLAEPYYLRAVAKVNLEDYKGAEEDCSASIERNKFITDAYKLRGFCRQTSGRDSLAIADYDKGLEYAPTDKQFLFYKAVALTSLDRPAEADSVIGVLLKSHPNFDEAYTVRARTHLMRGDTIAAEADIRKSLEKSKNIINNYLMLADIHVKQQKWAEAAADLDEVVRLEPHHAEVYVNRAYLRYNIDDYFGAMADYNYALELDPDNRPATYNRALLRLEVRDLNGALADFSKVLTYDPENFHARYNRALILMELHKYRQAIDDFTAISKKYPKFYPVYYGIAQAREALGDRYGAIRMMLYAEDLVRKYVDNPRRNPLDRPVIDAGKSNPDGMEQKGEETEIEVMERFNRLVTVNTDESTPLKYSDRIKGKVQDRATRIEPEPMFGLSLVDGRTTLRPSSNYFKEIEDINRSNLLPRTLYVTNTATALTPSQADDFFALSDNLTSVIASGHARPIDYFGRAVTLAQLKNYEAAEADLNKAIELNPGFAAAYLARAVIRETRRNIPSADKNAIKATQREIIEDLEKAIELSPRLIYAWFDKGNIYYDIADYTSALSSYNKAIEISPDFAEAYYNRGLTYLSMGNIQAAFADLSRAGELGILPAYRVLKEMSAR